MGYECDFCHVDHMVRNEECPEQVRELRRLRAEQDAKVLVDQISHFVNGMNHEQMNAFCNALASEHPTLLGQIAKAVAVGVMRRALYNPEWKPFDRVIQKDLCQENLRPGIPNHARHDGRLACYTVIGAELMAHQFHV